MKKKKAFTMAETLIALAIIGVIASLTMPSVIKNYKAKELETRRNKIHTIISDAMTLAMVQAGATNMLSTPLMKCYKQTGDNRTSCLKEASGKIFKITTDSIQSSSILSDIKSKTYTAYAPYTGFSILQSAYGAPEPVDPCAGGNNPKCDNYTGESDSSSYKPWDDVSYAFVTSDSMMIGYESPIESDGKLVGFYMIIDTNGQKIPNKIGSDLLKYSIDKNGQPTDRTCEFNSSCEDSTSNTQEEPTPVAQSAVFAFQNANAGEEIEVYQAMNNNWLT